MKKCVALLAFAALGLCCAVGAMGAPHMGYNPPPHDVAPHDGKRQDPGITPGNGPQGAPPHRSMPSGMERPDMKGQPASHGDRNPDWKGGPGGKGPHDMRKGRSGKKHGPKGGHWDKKPPKKRRP